MRATTRVLVATLATVAVLGAWRAANAAWTLGRVRTEVQGRHRGVSVDVPLRGVHVLRLRADGGTEPLDLGGLDRAVIFAFEASCEACNRNMANWIDLVRDSGGSAPGRFYALTVMPPGQAGAYWAGLDGDVQVLVTDTATIARRLGTPGPPSTLLVRDGRIRRQFHGLLDENAKREIARAF